MSSGKSSFAVQDKIRGIYFEKILSRLDGLFSELITPDVIIRLDRLDLDLGPIGVDTLEQDLTERTIHAARKILKEKLRFGVDESRDMEVIPVQKSTADVVLYFLEYGRLPWWSRIDDLRRLESGIMENRPVSMEFRAKFRMLIEKNSVAGQRLVLQFSDPFLQYMIPSCFADRASGSPEETVAWFKVFYGDPSFRGREEKGSEKTGREKDETGGQKGAASTGEDTGEDKMPAGHPETIAGKAMAAAANAETGTASDGQEHREGNPVEQGTDNKTSDISAQQEKAAKRSGDEALRPGENEGAKGENPSPGSSRPRGNDPMSPEGGPGKNNDGRKSAGDERPAPDNFAIRDTRREDNRHSRNYKDDTEPVYTGSAGLVILHPFLTEFFTGLDLMEGKTFRDEGARHKAVHLLGYLATGLEEIQEPRLVFPKVLCGMEIARPVQQTGIITQEEMEEAEKLLDTVIEYWKALKNTSARGLRDSFLQRPGKLSRKEDGWQLDIEKKTLDILLGKLPWGFSIIRLPWMKEMIFVNWG